jgi:hypothetical protein
LGQQLFSTIHVRHDHAVQQIANLMEVQGAKNYGSLDCGGSVLPAARALVRMNNNDDVNKIKLKTQVSAPRARLFKHSFKLL